MNLHYPSRPLLVLDAAIEAPEQLRKGAIDAAQVLQLDAQRHGLEQISEYLEQHRGITSLHLMAHGQPGGVQLGQTWLTSQNLDQWGDRLRQWSRSLSPQGSVVLYGCRTGAGTLGQTFLTHLHRLLGVTLAASSHVVGQGQWHFDRILRSKSSQDSAETSARGLDALWLPFHPDTLASYPGRFNTPNFFYSSGGDNNDELFLVNPTNAERESIGQLADSSFALSRNSDGDLFYTDTKTVAEGITVYKFDFETGNNQAIGSFNPITRGDDDPISGDLSNNNDQIVKLGQSQDGRIYGMGFRNRVLYAIDPDNVTDGEVGVQEIGITGIGRGGGDIAFDPDNENVFFITARRGSSNDYQLYRVELSFDAANQISGATGQQVGIIVNEDEEAINGRAGALGFGADNNLYFNAESVMYRLDREQLSARGADNLPAVRIGDIGEPISDFASLPQATVALNVTVEKDADADSVNAGGTVNYQVTIENNGITDPRTNDISPGTIPDIQVSDPLPDGIESFSWTRQILNADGDVVGSTSGSGAISDTFDLEANQRAVYQVAATVSSLPSGDAIQNTARVRVPGFGIVDPNNPDRLLPEVTATDSIEIGNQPPEVDDGLVTTPPGEVTAVDVLFGSDDGTIERYVIDTIPEGGVLRVNGREIGPGDSISADELDQLVFDANDNFDGSSFTYRAIDNQGEASEPGEITLNSPPQVTGGEEDVPPGAVTNLSDDLFSGEDPDGTINRYEITELPPASQGTLFIGDPERGGREVAEGETLTPDQLDRLFFRAEPGFSGTTFGFRAIDNQGAESPTAEVTLGTANAPPDTEDVLQVIEPGEPVTLNGLGGTDIESDEGDLTYQIDELPGEGTLTLDGEEISAGAVLTPDELARLQFSFPEGFTGNTSFTYVAIDETGAEDPTPGTVFLKTEGSNIPPETEETTVEVPPNTFGGANEIPRGVATRLTGLGGNDPDGEIDEFRITRAPGNGTLFLGDPADGGRALGTDDTIPANRIDDVFFLPDDNFNGSDFAYTAIDNESEEDPTPAEVTLEVGNRFPDTDNVTNPVPEPGEVIRLSGLGGSDEDGNISGFVINTLPNRGTLFLGRPGAGGVAVEEGQILTPDELSRLFLDVGDGSGDIRFTYSAIDNLGAIDPIPGEVRFTNQTTSPDDEEEEDDDDPVPDIGGDPSPSPTPSADPDPDPEPDPDFDSLCPPKPEKPEIPQLAELPEVNRQMPDPLPALQVDGLEQLDSVEVLDSTAGNLVVGGSGDDEIRGSLGDDQLRGSQGNDRIVTGGGNNALAGNQGDDTLLGHQGDDTLNGGQDRDLILGRGGNNVIWGDRGDDTISGGPGNDIIGGGPQNRTPEFEGSDDLIYGDGGNDTIFGNLGQTSLSGGEGDDMIFGGRGDDQVHGDAGSDTLKGEFGNDTLIGSPDTIEPARDAANEAITNEDIANEDLLTDAEAFTPPELTFEFLAGLEDPREATEDPESSPEPTPEPTPEPSPDPTPEPSPDPVSTGDLLSGNDGDDVLFGGAGSDSLFGGDDNDWLDGGSADDLLFGDRGADTLYGNQGNNTLVGGSLNPDRIDEDGPDLLYGGIGNDLILGNRGDDTISTGNGNNLAFGGQNNDLIYGGQGSDTLKGEFGDDTLLGSPRSLSAEAAVSNLLSGNKGNDVILAGHGGDRVYGGDGEDLIFGGDGTDLMFGDRGDDTIHGGEGNDTLVAANGNPLVRENDGNNLIFAGEGEDLVLGGSGNDSLIGNDGNDTVRGGRGNDMVWGDSGDDLLFGDHGNDTLCGGSGNDTLVAGNGNPNDPATGDNLLIGAAGNNVMFGNGGQDTFQGGLGNDTIYGGSGDVIVFGERGNNVIFGQRGNDTLAGGNDSSLVHGGQGNDVLFGNAGNNTLYGGQDDDTLYSGRGNSRLFGDEGDDLLFGQRGNDTLIGGGGQNGFAISNEAENNLILDFDLTQDAFVLFDGITREDLTFDSRDGQTLLQRNGQTIAILVDVGLEQVNEITFR